TAATTPTRAASTRATKRSGASCKRALSGASGDRRLTFRGRTGTLGGARPARAPRRSPMRRILSPSLTLVVGTFVLASLAAPASAGSASANVSVSGGVLIFVAGAGQIDHVFVNVTNTPGTSRVTDDAPGGLTPGAGRMSVDATDIDCSGGIVCAFVRLLDGN